MGRPGALGEEREAHTPGQGHADRRSEGQRVKAKGVHGVGNPAGLSGLEKGR